MKIIAAIAAVCFVAQASRACGLADSALRPVKYSYVSRDLPKTPTAIEVVLNGSAQPVCFVIGRTDTVVAAELEARSGSLSNMDSALLLYKQVASWNFARPRLISVPMYAKVRGSKVRAEYYRVMFPYRSQTYHCDVEKHLGRIRFLKIQVGESNTPINYHGTFIME